MRQDDSLTVGFADLLDNLRMVNNTWSSVSKLVLVSLDTMDSLDSHGLFDPIDYPDNWRSVEGVRLVDCLESFMVIDTWALVDRFKKLRMVKAWPLVSVLESESVVNIGSLLPVTDNMKLDEYFSPEELE